MMRGVDPRLDYAYGNSPAAFDPTKNRPWYSFIFGSKIPTPGAMAYANETEWLAFRPMIGPAIGQAVQFRTLYNVFPIMQQQALAALTGLGGLNHGQVALQPLTDPYSGNS
jgi:hypothetical protein